MKSFSEIVKLILSFFLNKRSAKYLHWEPKWFGEKEHSRELPAKVAKFQKVYGVKETGIVDEGTVRRRATEKEALKQVLKDVTESKDKQEGFIICDGKKKNIEWNKVVLFDEDDGLRLSSKNFKKFNGVRKPTMFVVHWDVCLSSRSCFNILQNRGLSVHFLIDNDGTIFQIMDCNDIGWRPESAVDITEHSQQEGKSKTDGDGGDIEEAAISKSNADYGDDTTLVELCPVHLKDVCHTCASVQALCHLNNILVMFMQ